MYKDDDYIKTVNKTYSKTFSQRQTLPNYLSMRFKGLEWMNVLDYGAGKDAYGTMIMREKGFNVTAYDIGKNCVEGIHDPLAITKKYELVFASNVINIQTSYDDILDIFEEIKSCMYKYNRFDGYSEFYFNIPGKPRKCDLNMLQVLILSESVFGEGKCKLIYGDTESEMYRCSKFGD